MVALRVVAETARHSVISWVDKPGWYYCEVAGVDKTSLISLTLCTQ